jgi:hypothetical protein
MKRFPRKFHIHGANSWLDINTWRRIAGRIVEASNARVGGSLLIQVMILKGI